MNVTLSPAPRSPELVLCCLAEVVLEHEVDPQHLPLLLHVAVTAGDHEEPVVAAHAQQLVINLLYRCGGGMCHMRCVWGRGPRGRGPRGRAGVF